MFHEGTCLMQNLCLCLGWSKLCILSLISKILISKIDMSGMKNYGNQQKIYVTFPEHGQQSQIFKKKMTSLMLVGKLIKISLLGVPQLVPILAKHCGTKTNQMEGQLKIVWQLTKGLVGMIIDAKQNYAYLALSRSIRNTS